MAILEIKKDKMKALDPCIAELINGGMKIIEVIECILDKVPTKQLQAINDELMDEIAGIEGDRDKINNMYTGKGV